MKRRFQISTGCSFQQLHERSTSVFVTLSQKLWRRMCPHLFISLPFVILQLLCIRSTGCIGLFSIPRPKWKANPNFKCLFHPCRLSSTFRIFKVEVHLSLVLEFFGRDLLPNFFYTENIGFLLKVIVSFYKLEALRTAKVKSFNTYKSQEKGKMLTVIKLNIIWCRTWRFKYRDELLRPSMCHLNGQQQCRRPSLSSPSHQE